MAVRPRFTFIDLFAGIGGFRLAFERAGGRCLFSSEWDGFAAKTYEANFGERPDGDMTKIAAEDVPNHMILTAGVPCQPFSIAGVSKNNALGRRHGFEHATQGTLFFDVARIIAHKRPQAFVIENVKNLRNHDRGRTFAVIMQTLREELGYHVPEPQIIDARNLVPQHRERIYIVGFRNPKEANRFKWPIIEDQQPSFKNILDMEVNGKYTLSDKLWQYLRDYADKHRAKGNGFGFGLTDLDGIARTLSARYYKDGSEILVPQQGKNPRRLTPRECARLMGFPEEFQIVCSDTRAYKQFGNAVVVPVVEALAKAMAAALYPQTKRDRRKPVEMPDLPFPDSASAR
ncbi:MAG: DNA (cytosine-5-)-methyltransferase [Blastocatellia bacterium]